MQESREDETSISPNKNEDEDGDDHQKSVTGVKICTMKSWIESFIRG